MDESQRHKRHRSNIIGLQTSILAWAVEFVTGLLVWIDLIFGFSSRHSWERVLIFMTDVFLFSVVQPCTYIFKTRQVKDLLSDSGWYHTIRVFFKLEQLQVAPNENIEMNPVVNTNPPIRHTQQPIPTISGSIENASRAFSN